MECEEVLNQETETLHPHHHSPWLQRELTFADKLSGALGGLMVVEEVTVLSNEAQPPVKFGGQLADGDQDVIFDEIVRRFEALGYTPLLHEHEGIHTLHAVPHVVERKPGKTWLNILLFVLTWLSVLYVGALHEGVDVITNPLQLWHGWPFAVTIMSILSAHELSHYFVGRRYNSPVSLPYFIPLPGAMSILGTMGAVIVQKGPMRSRKALFDIGVAGPIGGLLLAVPLLFAGLAFTEVVNPLAVMDVSPGEPLLVTQEGNSLLYLGAKYVIHGRILPDKTTGEDVWLSPPSPGGSVVFAAWAGLLVTALNLFPIGQLDGGHIAYAMWGRQAWKIARVFLFTVFIWGIILFTMRNLAGLSWLMWGGLGVFMGPRHPPPLNDLTPLDAKRIRLGWLVVVIFLLILVPIPLVYVAL